jgi:hypothetical protein
MVFLTIKSTVRDMLAGILGLLVFGSYFLRGVWLPHLAESKHRNLYALIALIVFFAGAWLVFALTFGGESRE